MAYGIPVIGWIVGFLVAVSVSIPFYFIWNGLAPTYFYFLPDVYLSVPFWHCVGLFMLSPMLKWLVVPNLSSVRQNNENKAGK